MIKLDIEGRNYHIDEKLKNYIEKKFSSLDKYLPREHKNGQMRVEIFKDPSGKEDNRYQCRAHLDVPAGNIVAHVATMNPHSAVDIVEEKLKLQIRKYKDKYKPRHIGFKTVIDKIKPKKR
jgi:putative sigma-54 modulation protein